MGQQQLLLLVLGIVIVGLAVVAGINAFSENQKKSNKDALVTESFRLATDAQAWKLKPSQYGGGGGDFTGFTFQELQVNENNMSADFLTYTTPWGTVAITGTPGTDLTLDLVDQNSTDIGDIVVASDGEITYDDTAVTN